MLRLRGRIARRSRLAQGVAALLALLGALALALVGVAVFRTSPVGEDASVWRVLLTDQATIGFLRLAIIAIALYAIASAAALMVGGRWLRGLGSSGLQVDDAQMSEELVEEYRARVRSAERAQDEAMAMARELMRWLNQP